MSSDDEQQAKFVSQSLMGKFIEDIPGMTDVYAAKLKKQGIEHVRNINYYCYAFIAK